ncbi:MAG TPA: UbiD family decarboxylase [Pirellulales bacterium]|nr:UbiD family decarboxylase [Pirellulales bacterium]
MPFHSLADFVESLEQAGELARVKVEVDPELELAAVTCRVAQAGGPALFFERVKGCHPPVVTNLLGTPGRVCRALGAESLDELAERFVLSASLAEPAGWLERFRPGSMFDAAKHQPKTLKSGICQQVVKLGRDVDLAEWPAPRSWPSEPRRSITAGVVLTVDRETGQRSLAAPPLAIVDRNRLAVGWHRYHAASRHLADCRSRGRQLPVAIVLGGDPALWVAVAAPLPIDADGCLFAGLLRGKPLEVVKCRSHDLEVPADAEIVIEGFVDPVEPPATLDPLGHAGGYYSLPAPAATLHVTAVTHRANPIFPAVVSSRPPNETSAIGRAIERLWLPLVRRAVPDLVDYSFAEAAGPGTLCVASIRKTLPRHARKAAGALWGLDALMHVKLLVIVDADVAVNEGDQVLMAVGANVHPGRDVFFHDGPPRPLDHAAPPLSAGGAVCIDATAKFPEEHGGPWPERLATNRQIMELVQSRWAEYGLGPPWRSFST